MGSKSDAVVPYGRPRSRSRSRGKDYDTFKSSRTRMAEEKVEQKRFAKEQAAARVEAAVKAVEVAQKALEAAIAADVEATNALQEATMEAASIGQEVRIQDLVDERQEARRKKDFRTADKIEGELRSLGVEVNNATLTWKGPNGLSGQVKSGNQLGITQRPGDWACAGCGALCFANKDKCFKCGTRKSGGVSDNQKDRDRGGDRRSSGYDRYDDRSGGRDNRGGRDRGDRGKRHDSNSDVD